MIAHYQKSRHRKSDISRGSNGRSSHILAKHTPVFRALTQRHIIYNDLDFKIEVESEPSQMTHYVAVMCLMSPAEVYFEEPLYTINRNHRNKSRGPQHATINAKIFNLLYGLQQRTRILKH